MTRDRDALIERLVAALGAHEAVRGVWLGGSLGRGEGDAYSDVDLVVAVDDAGREDFLDGWDAVAASIAPIVLSSRLGGGSFAVLNHVTAGWLRFDVSVVRPAAMSGYTRTGVRTLLDRDGLDATLRPHGELTPPDARRVAALTTEFFRVLGLLPVVVGRQEYAVGASGAGLLRTMLIQLATEDVPAEDRGGVLHLRRLLPARRMAEIDALPAIEATRESVVAAHLAAAALFLPLARDLSARTGVAWPDTLESALRTHLARELSLDLPA